MYPAESIFRTWVSVLLTPFLLLTPLCLKQGLGEWPGGLVALRPFEFVPVSVVAAAVVVCTIGLASVLFSNARLRWLVAFALPLLLIAGRLVWIALGWQVVGGLVAIVGMTALPYRRIAVRLFSARTAVATAAAAAS